MNGKMLYVIIMTFWAAGGFMIYGDELNRFQYKEISANILKRAKERVSKFIIKKNSFYHDRELFSSSVILKNLSLVRRETPLSADYIYENLMKNSSLLKPMYSEILTLYRSGRDEEAFRVPVTFIGTKAARQFAMILSKLEKLNPAELTEQMEVFQKMMIESRMTFALKRTQRNSLIITAMSAASVFILLINFAVVVVFMDAINILNTIFA